MVRSLPILAAALVLAAAGGCSPRDPGVPVAYVAVAGNNHVQVIDLETAKTLRKIYAGTTPWRLAVSPGRDRLWIQHWGSATTAVIDLGSHEILRVLPTRGPGAFSADGETFYSFDWPGSGLDVIDGRTFERREQRVTEIPRVYDVAAAREDGLLWLVQHDPMARGPRERFGYALAYPVSEKDPSQAVPVSRPTGQSPAAVKVLRTHPFLLTADRETNGLTLLNALGDGRAVPTCPAPQAVVLSPDETRMIVPCWQGEGARQSRVFSYKTDFSTRPWPTLVQDGEATVDGALVAGAFSPSGSRLYLVDRSGNRLLEANPLTLELIREIPTGDVPVDVAVMELPADARDRAAEESRARRIARAALDKARAAGRRFRDLSWTETVGDRTLRSAAAPPDRLRVETGGGLRLAAGGDTVALHPGGRFWVTPRQEILSLVYNLPNLTADEALRQLAGDVSGSPFLRGGLAVDVAAEVEEQGVRYAVLGATRKGERVSQLWLDAGTGRPASLVEQFPVFRSRGHDSEGFGGLVETKFLGSAGAPGGVWLPARLERVLDGRTTQEVKIGNVRVNTGLSGEAFDLPRLGGTPPPAGLFRAAGMLPASAGGPGRAVPVSPHPYLKAVGEPHPPYSTSPPTSGPRLAWMAGWGVHRVPVPLELQAHNLEHGGVALQYNCPEGCPDLVAKLAALARERDLVLVAPYPWIQGRIALTAWGRIEVLDGFDEARIRSFLDAYAGQDHHAEGGGTEEAGAPALRAPH
jgi:YVTN family beta-propeller protein